MTKNWLVTGSASGLGRDITETVLRTGGTVVAGARRPDVLAALCTKYGERLLAVELDVRDEGAAQTAVRKAVQAFGRIDVLVNNAGYQFNAPFEQITSEQFRNVVETCLFGMVHMTRAAVPVMRHAAKWAIGGFSDSLADEVVSFGVKICTLEPGGIGSDFRRRASETLPPLLPDYEASVGPVYRLIADQPGLSENDPERIANLLIKLSQTDTVPKRLILGKAAKAYVERVEEARANEMEANRALTLSTVAPDGSRSEWQGRTHQGRRRRQAGPKCIFGSAASVMGLQLSMAKSTLMEETARAKLCQLGFLGSGPIKGIPARVVF